MTHVICTAQGSRISATLGAPTKLKRAPTQCISIVDILWDDDIATEKQVSIRSHRNDIATGGGGGGTNSHRNDIATGGGTNSHRSDIDTGVDSIIATCRGDSY